MKLVKATFVFDPSFKSSGSEGLSSDSLQSHVAGAEEDHSRESSLTTRARNTQFLQKPLGITCDGSAMPSRSVLCSSQCGLGLREKDQPGQGHLDMI